jgi:hypothetical protein
MGTTRDWRKKGSYSDQLAASATEDYTTKSKPLSREIFLSEKLMLS